MSCQVRMSHSLYSQVFEQGFLFGLRCVVLVLFAPGGCVGTTCLLILPIPRNSNSMNYYKYKYFSCRRNSTAGMFGFARLAEPGYSGSTHHSEQSMVTSSLWLSDCLLLRNTAKPNKINPQSVPLPVRAHNIVLLWLLLKCSITQLK